MKRSEMNTHQRLVFDLMREVMSEYIGGYENTLLDEKPGSVDYEEAKAFLESGREALTKAVYDEVMERCKVGTNATHARFAGSEFLRERIDRRLAKWGY